MNATHQRMADWLEQAWLQRYLDRGLSPEEAEWFEVYAIDKPHLVQALELDSDLRDGLHAQPTRAAGPGDAVVPLRGRTARARTLLPLGMAATLVAGTAIGWILAPQAGGDADIQAGPTRIVFDSYRGEAAKPLVHAGAPDTVLVEVGLPHDATDVQLRIGERAVPLTVSPDGFASFLWHRQRQPALEGARLQYVSAGEVQVLELPLDSAAER